MDERKVSEGEAQAVPQPLLNGLHYWICLSAIRALVIAILEQHDRGIRRTLDVVPVRHWQRRFGNSAGHFALHCPSVSRCSSSSAARIPPAPGFTPTGDT